jgi:uncharacterized protein with HEPN domain
MPESFLRDNLVTIKQAIDLIEKRFDSIRRPEDFIADEEGLMRMDAISMRLQVIGEKVKSIERKNQGLLALHGIDVLPIIRFRDFISHHYEDADYEILFNLCQVHLPELKDKILLLLREL